VTEPMLPAPEDSATTDFERYLLDQNRQLWDRLWRLETVGLVADGPGADVLNALQADLRDEGWRVDIRSVPRLEWRLVPPPDTPYVSVLAP
jgi:N-acetyl-beta-hexosaminidase